MDIAGPGLGPSSAADTPMIDALFHQGQRINKAVRPIREEYLGQMLEALRTGGINARIPVVQQAVSQSMEAASRARQATLDSLAKAGLSNTPYGQNILAQLLRAGNQATAAIPTTMAMDYINQAPTAITNIGNQGLGAIQNAASMDLQRQEFAARQYQALMEDIKQSMMFAGSAAAGMGGGGGGNGGADVAVPSTVSVPQYGNASSAPSGAGSNYGPYAGSYSYMPPGGY